MNGPPSGGLFSCRSRVATLVAIGDFDATILQAMQPELRHAAVLERAMRVLDTRENAPPAWDDWTIRGDGHPDGRAHGHVANLIAKELRGLAK